MSELLEIAKQAVSLALKKGANDASATASRSRDVEIGWRDGKVEKVSEATTRGLSIALYVDGRYSAVSTSDLRPDALERFVEEAIAMAKTLSKDPARGLPTPSSTRAARKTTSSSPIPHTVSILPRCGGRGRRTWRTPPAPSPAPRRS